MTSGNTKTLQKKHENRLGLFEVLALLYIMHDRLPVVGYYMPSVIYLGVFGLLFVLALPAFYRKGTYIMLGFFAVSLLSFIVKLKSITTATLYLYGELQIFLNGLIALVVVAKNNQKKSRMMFWLIICMYVITCVTTIVGNDQYPMASRLLATDTIEEYLRRLYAKKNIGGFAMAYGLVLLTPLIIHLIKNKQVNGFIGIGLLGLFGATLFAMEYGTAVILFAASLGLLLIPKLNTKKIIIMLVVVILFVLLFGGVVADMFEQISLSVDSEALSERFMAVAEVLRGDVISSTSAQNRTGYYEKSWRVFLETLMLGRWGRKNVEVTGGHSFVLDTMGDYGLLGIVGVLIVLASMYKLAVKPFKEEKVCPCLLWTYILEIVLMFINPKVYGVIFLLIVPLFRHAFGEQEKMNAE